MVDNAQFVQMTTNDLERLKFCLDSNGNVAVRYVPGVSSWGTPVEALTNLPGTGTSLGEARVVYNDPSYGSIIAIWNGTVWVNLGSGGGGGVPLGRTITINGTTYDLSANRTWTVGDMLKSTYDPNNKNGDAFSMDNMNETATKKILTAAERTILSNTSNTNSGNETATSIGALIGGAGDATPNDTDFVATSLTAGGILKKITWTNVKAFLKTYFDTLYLNKDTTGKSAKTDALNSATTVVNVASATAPTTGQVLTATDSTHAIWQTPSGGGSSGGSYMFAIAGTIGATGTNVANTILVNGTKTITSVDLWYGTAGSGTLTVDVNKNGTTLFTTTKPSITTTNQGSVASGTLTTTSLASGDYLTIDIDAVPGTTLPVDLYVRVNYS